MDGVDRLTWWRGKEFRSLRYLFRHNFSLSAEQDANIVWILSTAIAKKENQSDECRRCCLCAAPKYAFLWVVGFPAAAVSWQTLFHRDANEINRTRAARVSIESSTNTTLLRIYIYTFTMTEVLLPGGWHTGRSFPVFLCDGHESWAPIYRLQSLSLSLSLSMLCVAYV